MWRHKGNWKVINNSDDSISNYMPGSVLQVYIN